MLLAVFLVIILFIVLFIVVDEYIDSIFHCSSEIILLNTKSIQSIIDYLIWTNKILFTTVKVSKCKLGLFEHTQSMSIPPAGLVYIGNTIY